MVAERVVDILQLVYLNMVNGHYLLEVLLPFLTPPYHAFTPAACGLLLTLRGAALWGGTLFEGPELMGREEMTFGLMLITVTTLRSLATGSASILLILLGLTHCKLIVLRK